MEGKKERTLHKWVCPKKEVFLLKAETVLLVIFVFLIFIFSFVILDQKLFLAFLATLFFILLFFLINHFFRKTFPLQESYQVFSRGISLKRKAGQRVKKQFLAFSKIKSYKFDKFLHGGRLETKKGKVPLFFNTREEIDKLEQILKKKLKEKTVLKKNKDKKRIRK